MSHAEGRTPTQSKRKRLCKIKVIPEFKKMSEIWKAPMNYPSINKKICTAWEKRIEEADDKACSITSNQSHFQKRGCREKKHRDTH